MKVQIGSFPLGVQNAKAEWSQRSVVLVRYEQAGRSAHGEAAPLPGLSTESVAEAHAELLALAPLVRRDGLAAGLARAMHPSVRFCLETVALDLRAQQLGQPLWSLLTERLPPAELLCNGLLAAPPERWREEAKAQLEAGAKTLKVKIGWPGYSLEEQLILLRELTATCVVRADANGTLSPAQARQLRQAFADDARFEYLEDPVALGDLSALEKGGAQIAADELWMHAKEALLARDLGLRAVVLKPSLVGAPSEVLRQAREAQHAGLEVVLSHAFEGPIAYTMLVQLAFALARDPALAVGLAPHLGLPQPRTSEGRYTLARPTAPGLGVDPLWLAQAWTLPEGRDD